MTRVLKKRHIVANGINGITVRFRIGLFCQSNWNTYVINDFFKKACEEAPGISLRFIIRSIPVLRYFSRVRHLKALRISDRF